MLTGSFFMPRDQQVMNPRGPKFTNYEGWNKLSGNIYIPTGKKQ